VTDSNVLYGDADLAAVIQLLADYGRFVDDRDGESWAGLFGASGTLAVGDREITGRQALAEFAVRSPRGVHLQGVPGVEKTPDGAIRASSSFAFLNGETGEVLAGAYADLIARTDGGLAFVRRHIDIRVHLRAAAARRGN